MKLANWRCISRSVIAVERQEEENVKWLDEGGEREREEVKKKVVRLVEEVWFPRLVVSQ